MQRVSILALVALAAACAPHDAIMRDIKSMKGQPATLVFGKYGYPTEEKVIAGDTVYVWKVDTGGYSVPCTMRVIAGPDGLIKNQDITGSPHACGFL